MSTNNFASPQGKTLVQNIIWNLGGTGAPLIVAVLTIPPLIEVLGTARFGILTLAWLVVGYFSLFDFGLGRALTKLTASYLGSGKAREIPGLFWTAILVMITLGLLGAIALGSAAPWIVYSTLNVPPELQAETLGAFRLLAVSIPVVIASIGLRGYLEAHQSFLAVNVARVFMGLVTFAGPLVAVLLGGDLVTVVLVLVAGRVLGLMFYGFACFALSPELPRSIGVNFAVLPILLSFGGWMTVSNIIGPVILYSDRVLIGSLLSLEDVAYYATPFEMVTKVWLLPAAVVGVIFPAMTLRLAGDSRGVKQLTASSVKLIFLAVFPITLVPIYFAHEILAIWLGTTFADASATTMAVLLLGVYINSTAQIPSALLQALGRPDLKAKIHMIELPLLLVCLYWLTTSFGLVGAALTFSLRMVFDFIAFVAVAALKLPSVRSVFLRLSLAVFLGVSALLLPIVFELSLLSRICIAFVVCTGMLVIAWLRVLTPSEKSLLMVWQR